MAPDGYINVPKLWNSFKYNGKSIGSDAYGTYRLKVRLSHTENVLGLKLPSMSSCYRLYINGKLISQNGAPGTSKALEIPQWKPKVAFFSPDSKDLDIVVHISNFHHAKGGMWGNILMGNENEILKYRDLNLMRSYLLFGIFIFAAVFMLSLSLVEKNFPCLYFGLFCLSSALWEITVREVAIWNILGNISFTILPRLEYITMPLGLLFYTLFIYRLYKQESVNILYRMLLFISLALILLPLVTELRFFSRFVRFYMLHAFIVFSYAAFVVARSYLKGRSSSGIVLIGVVVLLLATINDTLYIEKINRYYGAAHFYAIAFSLFLACQIYVVFVNIFENYNRARQAVEFQLSLLQSQIKPHFLFNVLNTIGQLIDENPQKSKIVLNELGDHLRNKFKYSFSTEVGFISLGEELDAIGSLIYLANVRFDDRIQLHIDVNDKYLNYALPAFLLQPVVENSIKHGLGEGKLDICISAQEKGPDLILKVRDNGVGISKIVLYNMFEDKPGYENEQSKTGVGLKNIRLRMQLYYDRDIEIHGEKGKGTEVVFTLPLNNQTMKNKPDIRERLNESNSN